MAWYSFLFPSKSGSDEDGDGQPDLVEKEVPYEILIRFDDVGQPKGAHLQNRKIVTYKGEVIKNEIVNEALPLPTELKDTALMEDLLINALNRLSVLEASGSNGR